MKKWLVSFIFLVVLSLALASPVSADISDENIPTAIEIIRQINEFRVENGLYPYTFNRTLAQAAQDHSEWQAENRVVQHVGLDGSTERERNIIRGYDQGVATFKVDEMVYGGYSATPDVAMDFWIHSPVHYPLVVSEVYHEIGVGVAITDDGQKFYTVNIGMIPGITTRGASDYRAPSIEDYKGAKSVPITLAEPQDDGAIYHTYVEGQTMEAIAEAYGISLDTLLLLNDLAANSTPDDGVLLLIEQPVGEPLLVQTSTPTYTPFPTNTPSTTATPTQEPTPTEPEGIFVQPTQTITNIQPEDNSFPWPWVIIAGLFIVAAGVGIYWYLPTLRKTAQREGLLEDGDEDDDKHHRDFVAAHHSTTAGFDHLPRSEQSELLTEAARQALEAYPIQVVSMDLLRYVLNAEFLVTAYPQPGAASTRQYVLRVNAPGFHSKAEINSEVDWLRAIIRDTKLTVPEPVRTADGEWVTTVDLPQLGTWRHCVLFEYIEAVSVKDEIEPKQMEFLGALIALLHKHGERYQPPKGFIRKHWDLEGLKGEMLDVPPAQAYAALTEQEREVVADAEKLVQEGMDALGSDPKVYGLIHGDLHLKSLLFSGGRPVVIDFDTCGYGYYIYDLSVAIWDIFHREDFADLRAALLDGYRKVRRLSAEEETLLMHFVAGRLMAQVLTWAPRREHSPLTEVADKAIEKQINQLRRLVDYLER